MYRINKQNMGYERFCNNFIFLDFLVLNPFLPGSGSVTNFFRSWIQIRIKIIQIRHTEGDTVGTNLKKATHRVGRRLKQDAKVDVVEDKF